MNNNYNFGFLIISKQGVEGSSPSIVAFMCSNPDKTISTILPCLEYFPSNLTHHFLKGRTQSNCKIGNKLQFQAKDDFRRMFSFTKAKRESNEMSEQLHLLHLRFEMFQDLWRYP